MYKCETSESKNCLSKQEIGYCILIFLFYFIWAVSIKLGYAPDEQMRYDVSWFLYNNNRLPVYDELLNTMWGFSYAHLPTVLCNLLSYIPMKIVGMFTQDMFALLVAARMISVCAGAGTIYFLFKSARLMLKPYLKWFVVIFVSMIPQFAFLSSYLNNDIVAVFGSSIIFYAWVHALKFKWNRKNALYLAVGISVCALAYYNSYGWILCSIFLFIITYLMQNQKDYKGMMKLGILIAVVVLGCISYMFIRHVVLYGDLLGLQTQRYYGNLYAMEGHQFEGRHTAANVDMPLLTMLFAVGWVQNSFRSFVGVFGHMVYYCPEWIYFVYILFFVVALIGFVLNLVGLLKEKNIMQLLLSGSTVLCIVIPFILSIIYSYNVDYQPQGRYLYPGLIGVVFVVAKGYEYLFELLPQMKYRQRMINAWIGADICMMVYVFMTVFMPSV